jgi:hypothetical protein
MLTGFIIIFVSLICLIIWPTVDTNEGKIYYGPGYGSTRPRSFNLPEAIRKLFKR